MSWSLFCWILLIIMIISLSCLNRLVISRVVVEIAAWHDMMHAIVAGRQGSGDWDVHNEGDDEGDAIRGRGLRTPFCGSKRRGAVGGCAASDAEGRTSTQFLDRLSLPHCGWHSLQRRREWPDFPPWSSDQQRTANGSGHRHGTDRHLFR